MNPAPIPTQAPPAAPGPSCEAPGAPPPVGPTLEGDTAPVLPFGPAGPVYHQED